MTRPSELLAIAAYSLFLTGAARSFRTEGEFSSRMIMFFAILLDILAALLPLTGLQVPLQLAEERKPLVGAAVMTGVFVWVLSGACFALYSAKRLGLYHALVLVIEIVWFIDIMVFMYGVYR